MIRNDLQNECTGVGSLMSLNIEKGLKEIMAC